MMNKERALEELKSWTGTWCEADGDSEFRPCIECARDCVTKDTLKVAIECIEKQIAKTPIIKQAPHNLGGLRYVCCPNCEYTNIMRDYCPNCGQVIDWSDF